MVGKWGCVHGDSVGYLWRVKLMKKMGSKESRSVGIKGVVDVKDEWRRRLV